MKRLPSLLLLRSLVLSAIALACLTLTAPLRAAVFDVRAYGAKGDGTALDTAAINRTIEAAASAGGGEVHFPAGHYLCHSIHLRSHVQLRLDPGCTIVAAEPGQPGQETYDAAEANSAEWYQDFGHTHWHNSLIWGENIEDVSIVGPGQIFGRGLSRGWTPVAPDMTVSPKEEIAAKPQEKDGGQTQPKSGPFGYPSARDTLPNGVGNKAIALKNCRNVLLRDVVILHGGHFGVLATGVDNLTIDNLTIDTNRDGMDIDACNNVRISNCSVNSPWDDGICLKASYGLGQARPTENVTITNCFVSGFDEGRLLDGTRQRIVTRKGAPTGRIKLGTEASGGFKNITISNCVFEYCRGLALEQVDGAMLEDVVVSNITMRDIVNAPIFVRLGARLRTPDVTNPGPVQRITISHVVAYGVSSQAGILIAGLPNAPIRDLVLNDLQLYFVGGGTAEQAARAVPELENGYPEPANFGVLPSWGVYARHVAGLRVSDVQLRTQQSDRRPAVLLDDVSDARFAAVEATEEPGVPVWKMQNTRDVRVVESRPMPSPEILNATQKP